MSDDKTGIRIYLPDATYGSLEDQSDWGMRSRAFRKGLEAEFQQPFEQTDIGPGWSEPAFVTVLLEHAPYIVAGLIALFLSGEKIEKNLETWPRIYKRLTHYFYRKPTLEIDGAAVIAIEAICSVMNKTAGTYQLLGYRTESCLVKNFDGMADDTEIASIEKTTELVRSVTIHMFKIQADNRAFKVFVLGAEARLFEVES
jgi:hypothetical protein